MATEIDTETTAEKGPEATETGYASWFARYFGFAEHGTDLRTEVLAGVTTFLTMSYIVVLNPTLLTMFPGEGGKPGIAISGYAPGQIQQMLAVVTILAASVAIFTMAFYANRPFAQAPGIGLSAFMAFTVIGALGVPWQTALAAVFTEGVLFMALTAVGARKYVVHLFPEPVKLAGGTGIGAFLAIIGLQEMHVVVSSPATYVTLGSVASDPVAIVSLLGLFLTFVLYARGIRGSLIMGILGTAGIGYLLTWGGVVGPNVLTPTAIPSAQYNIAPLFGAFLEGFRNVEAFSFALIVFTFFFVDFFDTAGTVIGVGQAGDMLDEDGNLPEVEKPLMADAVGTTVGGILGTSTVTTYIDSATGVEEGGRTGMTALVVGLLFLASLVVVPLAAAIPMYASHLALVLIALIMFQNITEIEWNDITETIPAGLTILIMPLTFSIANGIAAGIISYPIVKAAAGKRADVRPGHWVLAAAFVLYFYVRTSGILQTAI